MDEAALNNAMYDISQGNLFLHVMIEDGFGSQIFVSVRHFHGNCHSSASLSLELSFYVTFKLQ